MAITTTTNWIKCFGFWLFFFFLLGVSVILHFRTLVCIVAVSHFCATTRFNGNEFIPTVYQRCSIIKCYPRNEIKNRPNQNQTYIHIYKWKQNSREKKYQFISDVVGVFCCCCFFLQILFSSQNKYKFINSVAKHWLRSSCCCFLFWRLIIFVGD